MKKLLLILCLILAFSSYAQTTTKKYNSLQKRYEYFENGKMVGYEVYNSLKQQWEYYSTKRTQSSSNYSDPVSTFDADLAIMVLAKRQAEYDSKLAKAKNREEREEFEERKKAISKMNQVIEYYNSFTEAPMIIQDGWHDVFSMNNYDFCDKRKVYVENNKIVKYFIDDWDARTVTYSLPIKNAITNIKLKEYESDMLKIFFLDALDNPNSLASPPIQPGKVSFWTNASKGDTEILVEGYYVGTLKSYFSGNTPNCGQSGTVVYKNKPGTYNFYAKSYSGSWSGTISISGTGCTNFKLSK
jgi:Skp family chaperone for outer membrane proteins